MFQHMLAIWPDHLTYLLQNLCASQEATIRTRHGAMDWFKMGQQYTKAYIVILIILTYMLSTSWEVLGWMKHKLESRLPGEISICRYAKDATFMAESKELRSLLMKAKEESKKVGLKLNIQKNKIMASGPITSWQIDAETVTNFIWGGGAPKSKVTWWLQPWN